MTKRITIEQTGFDVPIGDLDFFFSTAEEDLVKFFDDIKFIEEFSDGLDKEMADLHEKSKDVESLDEKKEFSLAMLDVRKRATKVPYDLLLGVGAFDKLNDLYSVTALLDTFPKVMTYVTDEIDKYTKKRQTADNQLIEQYRKKKKK